MAKKNVGVKGSQQISSANMSNYDTTSKDHRSRNKFNKEFDRCADIYDERWKCKYHYLLFSILLSSGNDISIQMMKLEQELSGGVFLVVLILTAFVFGLPLIYVEIFLGRYTKLTNCQIYRMSSIFFGCCLIIFLINVGYQIITVPQEAKILVNAAKALLNPNSTTDCLDDSKECYNYRVNGPLNDTCEENYFSLKCNKYGLIRYPMQYEYWKMYKDPDSKVYPYSRIITGVVITWGAIFYISVKELNTLGALLDNPKYPVNIEDEAGICKSSCKDFNQVHIGQTKRNLKNRQKKDVR